MGSNDIQDGFIAGYLAACQNILHLHDEPTVVVDALRHSGFSGKELLSAQRASGYRSRQMCPLIREAVSDG